MPTIELTEDEVFILHSCVYNNIMEMKRILRKNEHGHSETAVIKERIRERIEVLDKIIGKANNVLTL
jgi:hypothetical protein